MPLIPSKLNFLPSFDGRERLYSSIDPRKRGGELTIRILTVIPNHDRFAPIEASLSISVLTFQEHDEEYNAVSYHWGDINELENVVIHGSDEGIPGFVCKVPVSKNLVAALRQFRAKASADKQPLRLWIDALCINQTDASERQYQVIFMKWIFMKATSVWIWLGESDGTHEMVERGLAMLFQPSTSSIPNSATDAAGSPPRFLSSTLSLDEELLHIKQLAAVDALPYWRRGWTFQENMRAPRQICYGKLTIGFQSWSLIVRRCFYYASKMARKRINPSFRNYICPLASDAELRFVYSTTPLANTLVPFAFADELLNDMVMGYERRLADAEGEPETAVLVDARVNLRTHLSLDSFSPRRESLQSHFLLNSFYRTSDPRDAVFALREIIPGLANVELDYSRTPEHIFSIATESLLRETHGGLRELRQWFHPQASPQLPSWVFDFTHCSIDINENGHESFIDHATIKTSDASAGSLFRVVRCNKTSIHVPGFVFDNILDISCSTYPTVRSDQRWAYQLWSWIHIAQSHLLSRVTSILELATYTRTLFHTFGSGHKANNCFTLHDLRLPDPVRWESGPVKILEAMIKASANVDNHEEVQDLEQFMVTIEENTNRAKFFITENLRIGLAPVGAVIGDHIAVLASGNVPFVLRPVTIDYAGEEAYRIIGGCYVDGIVAGPARI